MNDGRLSRRELIVRAGLGIGSLIGAVLVAGCGGGGGGLGGPPKETVLDRARSQYGYGSEDVKTDGNYVTKAGPYVATDKNHGLIFRVNGVYPPDVGDMRWAWQYDLDPDDNVTWELLTK